MAEEKTITELVNDLYEIDNRIYTNKMRLKSIESELVKQLAYLYLHVVQKLKKQKLLVQIS